jgi:hypothetical protein
LTAAAQQLKHAETISESMNKVEQRLGIVNNSSMIIRAFGGLEWIPWDSKLKMNRIFNRSMVSPN